MTKWLSGLLCVAVFIGLSMTLLELPSETTRLTPAVNEQLSTSGVTNPVTAVLLNFRSYDTLLEIGVLLLALTGAWAVGRPQAVPSAVEDTALHILLRLFVPPIILGAGYFLWVGAAAPGGAFQGGAILAGGLILLLLGGKAVWLEVRWIHRGLLGIGLAVFLILAMLPWLHGNALIQYPVENAKYWILAIESAALVSIAFTLTALVLGGPPKHITE